MPWPQPTDYNAAVQNPALCFADADLRQAQPDADMLGLPRPHSGNFADVYQLKAADGQAWAVKCFTREVSGLAGRYRALSEHLVRARRSFLVDFSYLEQGICIRGDWFPILKMRWVEGLTLNQFLDGHAEQSGVLGRLAALWLKLTRELREAKIAHGDLQHGNVLLIPGDRDTSMKLRLIDYDGLWIPELAEQPSGEVGHPNYQHPTRLKQGGYGPEVDRFAALAIYTALRALSVGGRSLWKKYDTAENLLFREADFREPRSSRVLRELTHHADAAVRALAGRLVLALQASPEDAPLLEEFVDGTTVQPLSVDEMVRIDAVIGAAEPRRVRATTLPVAEVLPARPSEVVEVVAADPPPLTVLAADEAAPPALPPLTVLEVLPAQPLATPLPVPPMPRPLTVVEVVRANPAPPSWPARPTVPGRPLTVVDAAPADAAEAPGVYDMAPMAPPTLPKPPLPPRPQARSMIDSVTDEAAAALLLRPGPRRKTQVNIPLSPHLLLGLSLGGVALVALILGVVVVLASSRRNGAAPPAPPPTVPQARLVGAKQNVVSIRGGEREFLDVEIARGKSDEPLKVTLEDLPPHVVCDGASVAAGRTIATLEIRADRNVEAGVKECKVQLWTGEQRIEPWHRLNLSIQSAAKPIVFALPPITLSPGEIRDFEITIDRDACRDELTLRVANLPEDVRFQAKPCPAPQVIVPLRLEALPSAAEGQYAAVLELYSGVQKVAEVKQTLLVKKNVETAFRLADVGDLTVRIGRSVAVPIRLDRQAGFRGRVDVRLEGVPPGMLEWAPIELAETQTVGSLRIAAPVGTKPRSYLLKLVAASGDRTDTREFTLIIPELAKPAVGAEGRSRPATFRTFDGVELVGSFYPGKADRPCVLMLHDLSSDRSEEGFVHLATTLSEQGFPVLTFDFRGCGESTVIRDPAAFFQHAPNQKLRSLNRKNPLAAPPTVLTLSDYPASQHAWLANDVAAARLYLDVLNDQKEVNSSNMIVVGVGEGATVGALWTALEQFRYSVHATGAMDPLGKTRPNLNQPESRHLIGAVWINLSPTLGGSKADVNGWLARAIKGRHPATTVFVYGAKDGASVAQNKGWTVLFPLGVEFALTPIAEADQSGHALLKAAPVAEKDILRRVETLTARATLGGREQRAMNSASYVDLARKLTNAYQQRSGTLEKSVPIEWVHVMEK
jgi:pimeloyl-ACP methyl ester carboxylesterase